MIQHPGPKFGGVPGATGKDLLSESQPPLIFVYLGEEVPEYAILNLRTVGRAYQGEVVILTDSQLNPIPGVTVVATETFYNSADFEDFERASQLDPFFRGGFWLRATERLFVLRDFVRDSKIQRAFHAELDVMILNLAGLSDSLDEAGTGVFIPRQREGRGVASLIYWNSTAALVSVVRYLKRHAHLGNEMNVLGALLKENPGFVHPLPTEASLRLFGPTSATAANPSLTGLVDAADFGQWLCGYDPRNLHGARLNKFLEGHREPYLSGAKFSWSFQQRRLWVIDTDGTKYEIRAVHVHAKNFRMLTFLRGFGLHVALLRLPFKVVLRPSLVPQLNAVSRLLLSRAAGRYYSRLLPAFRPVVARLLDALLRRSSVVPSVRQRIVFASLLKRSSLIYSGQDVQEHIGEEPDRTGNQADLRQNLGRISPAERDSVGAEVGVFRTVMASGGPILVQRFEGTYRYVELASATTKSPLVVDADKTYTMTRLAIGFWPQLDLKRVHSFSKTLQILRPEYVAEMFPRGDDDLARWAHLALKLARTHCQPLSAMEFGRTA